MEENLRNVLGDVISANKENCSNQEKLENDTSSIVVNNICLSDRINLNKSSKEIYKRYCDTDNGSNTVRHRKRFLNLVDSDSVEETSLCEILNKNSNPYNEYDSGSSDIDLQISEHNSKNKNLRRIIDSESKEDIQTNESKNFPQMIHNTISATAENYQTLIDSESEEEKQNEEFKEDTQISGNNLPQTIHNVINTTIESYQTLIDSESEEEKQNEGIENDIFILSKKTFESKDVKKKSIKKRKGSIRASKNEAMRQIHSESQRLLRETEISLPYHRPKQRTLQEFLNRKKISATLPKAPSTAAKLKMSSAIVSQVLAEKEKEAELFYKSSDSEDDMQQSMPLVSKDIKISSITNEREMSLINIDGTCIQDPEKIEISIRNSQDNKKEIVKKDHLDLNAPKYQVFLEKDVCEIDQAVELTDNNDNADDGSDTSLQQITNEHNQNLRKLGLPKKLFDPHFENGSSEINRDEQEAKRIIETIISLNKEKCINEKKSKITVIENQILKVHQDDSEVINRRNKNLVSNITTSILQRANLEVTKILTLSSSINSKEVIETFQSDNDVSHNVICSNSNDCTIIQDENNEKKDKYSKINDVTLPSLVNNTQSKIQDNLSTNECEKFDGHIQGLPLLKFVDQTLTNRKKLSALKSNSKVTLRGLPGTIIDLTDAKPNKKGVNTLLDRFFCKHVNTKKQSNNKSEVTVIHLQNIENDLLPIKEVLPYKVPVNIDDSEFNKPGAKLMRLKENLKLQMTLKRNKEWKQKEKKLQAQEEEEEWNKEEKSDNDLDEEKTELGFELSDSEESELEENDICIKDKKRSKCQFADDEAKVTDNEDSSIEETCNENDADYVKHDKQSTRLKYRKEYMDDEVETDEENNDKDEVEENEESLDANVERGDESNFKDDDDINVCKSFSIANNKNDRKTRQFREEFQDDSNIINPSYLRNDNSQLNMVTDIDASKTHCKDNDWINENASNIPACQQHVDVTTRSQICKTPLMKTSMLDLISPITQLSVLNTTLDSNKKGSSEKRECIVECLSVENTQNDEFFEHVGSIRGSKSVLRKKLFDDIGETIDDKYLMRLCSGKFESTQRTDLDLSSQSNINELQLGSSESELCPGNSNVKLIDVKQSKISEVNDEMLEDIKLTLDNSNNSVNHIKKINKVNAIDSEIKYRIISSDDEDEDTFLRPKKRSAKKLNLSDSEGENSQFFDEENDGVDNEETEEQYVDYDSEENEMIVVPGKDIKKIAGGFLEEEAELSESDWDSSDEDEKNLDKLEIEEGDDEHIDEHEVKDQLEKIHMKQILDEDKREVRLLKELLFEDGDLHTDGTGRERKFKWRNIDKLGNNIEISQMSNENDGWVDVQEDEEEAKWSKLRYERDKFLEERMKCLNNEIEDELCDSQIFKLGLEAVRKIKDNGLQRQDTSLNKIDPSENVEPIMPRNITDLLNGSNIGKKCQTIYNVIKKRSLLTRGEESLARIASLAKQSDSASNAVNTRNFVFPHIDQSTNNTFEKEKSVADLNSQIKPGKRKMMSNMSSTLKKRRK